MKKILLTATGLGAALAACASPTLEIREAKSPLTQGEMPTSARVAEGHAMLRLGNVGLAIEAYRKALRQSPQDAAAHAALANAYERMGRFDLSQRYYEKALAYAPHRPELYEALAASLARQGRPVEAARVKAEAMTRQAALQAQVAANEELAVAVDAAVIPDMPTPQPTSAVSVSLDAPAIAYAEEVASSEVAPILDAADVQAVDAPQVQSAPVAEMAALDVDTVDTINAPLERQDIAAQDVDLATASLMDSAMLPEMELAPAPSVSMPLDPVRPQRMETARFDEVRIATGPRLERVSTSEVMLITKVDDARPMAPVPTRRAESAVAVLQTRAEVAPVQAVGGGERIARARVEPAPVLLINASARTGVAENARGHLASQGYAELKIDSSPTGRARSILLYPRGQRAEAEKLAKRFGFPVVFQVGPVEQMTLHLGRDAAKLFGEA